MNPNSTPEVHLLPGAERVIADAVAGLGPSLELYRLQLAAEQAVLVAGFEELVCLETLDFTPFAYQIRAAQQVLRRFRGRGLLSDEVGLGKTIEAGLVLKEYLMRQMVSNVLILTPPALVEQWREELAVKFKLDDFITTGDPRFRKHGPEAWAQFPRVIASLATARLKKHRDRIAPIPYDLVILDEAHHLKNRSSVSWKFVNGLQRRFMLMLTATPVQNNLDELYNLITLLKPGQLKSPREFRRRFVVKGDPRLPRNRGKLRELLADVMVRHTRGQVSVRLPPRQAHTVQITLSPEEMDLYRDISLAVRRGFKLAMMGGRRGAFRFTLQTIQREIGSSPQAADSTLRALAEQPGMSELREELLSLADRTGRIPSWAKGDALEKLLGSIFNPANSSARSEKVIIFTHFLRTLDLLAGRLKGMGLPFVVYHGGLSTPAKNQVIRDFEGPARVLLSTEAAGEGRNLQFCRTLINFDLPWNPMRIEQRVGRIHRIGQDQEVRIYNLAAGGTIEDHILDILDRKLNMFELVIGEMDMILGHLSDGRDFENLVLEAWTQAESADEVAAGFQQLGETLVQARQAYQDSQAYDDSLFGEDFATE